MSVSLSTTNRRALLWRQSQVIASERDRRLTDRVKDKNVGNPLGNAVNVDVTWQITDIE